MQSTFSKKKLINLTKFQLFSNYLHIFINIGVIILNIIIAVIVTNSASEEGAGSGSIDGIFITWMLVLGITFFTSSFKFALLNGVSRKTFFLSGLITLTAFSFALSIICALFIILAESVATTFTIYTLMYGKNILGMFVWLFTLGIFLAMLGWFIICVFYRTNKKQRLIIGGALLLFPALYILVHYLTDGALGRNVVRFLIKIIGYGGVPNPYIAAVSFIVLSIILCAGVFLLVRRAGIRE